MSFQVYGARIFGSGLFSCHNLLNNQQIQCEPWAQAHMWQNEYLYHLTYSLHLPLIVLLDLNCRHMLWSLLNSLN